MTASRPDSVHPAAGGCPFLARSQPAQGALSLLPWPGRLWVFEWYRRMRTDATSTFPAEAFTKDMLEIKFLWSRGFIVSHPEAVRRILRDNVANYIKSPASDRMLEPGLGRGLLTSTGREWLSHRRLLAPAFDRASAEASIPLYTAAATHLADAWDRLPDGSALDLVPAMMATTVRVIAQILFTSDATPLVKLMASGLEGYQAETMPNLLDLLHFPVWLAAIGRHHRLKRMLSDLYRALEQRIAERIPIAATGPLDALGRLLRYRDAVTGEPLSLPEVRAEILTIFFAGHETSSMSLTWAWYLLALHPEAEAKLHAELATVLQGRLPTPADVPRLIYTLMVLQEAMRLYPPIHTLASRIALADDELAGVKIPAGSYLSISPWVLHRHASLWDQPDRFDPERFSAERSAGRHPYAYLPFSAGPRNCLAATFALTESVVLLATLAQRYRVQLAPGPPVTVRGRISLQPRNGIRVFVHRRS